MYTITSNAKLKLEALCFLNNVCRIEYRNVNITI